MQKHQCALITLFCAVLLPFLSMAQLNFQVKQLPTVYQQRELKASVNLKNVLTQQRKLIADKKLSFFVANTAVSDKTLESITGVLPVNAPEADKLNAVLKDKVISADLAAILKQ